jgi:hypothetical protein
MSEGQGFADAPQFFCASQELADTQVYSGKWLSNKPGSKELWNAFRHANR